MMAPSRIHRAVCAALTVATLTLTPLAAHALSWSQPKLLSKPDRPMRLLVRLDDVSVAQQRNLRASLAPKAITGETSTDVPVALQGALIKLEPIDRNTLELHITGAAPLREPHLMFYVLLQWEGGQALVPVSYTAPGASAPVQPKAAPEPAPQATALPAAAPQAAAQPAPEPKAEPAPEPKPEPVKAEPAPEPKPEPVKAEAAPEPKPEPVKAEPKAESKAEAKPETLRVKRGDTASELIQGYQDATVNLDQMLLALLARNPQAFVDNNVNRLRSDVDLQVPSLDEARAIDKTEARRQIRLQIDAFAAYKAAVAQRLNQVEQSPAKQSASGDLVKPEDKQTQPQDQLKISQADTQAADQLAKQQNQSEAATKEAQAQQDLNALKQLADQAGKASTESAGTQPPAADAPKDEPGVKVDKAPEEQSLVMALEKDPTLPFVGAGLLVLLVLFAVAARRRARARQAVPVHDFTGEHNDNTPPDLGLPPGFNLDLDPAQNDSHASANDPLALTADTSAPEADLPPQEEPATAPGEENPFTVRLKLATELWNLGQVHTSRALAEEVLEQGDPESQAAARRWLEERP